MKKLKLTAAAVAAAVAISSMTSTSASAFYCYPKATPATGSSGAVGPYVIFGCAAGIIIAAFAANARDNRELTQAEALSCGLLFWLSQPHKRHKRHP